MQFHSLIRTACFGLLTGTLWLTQAQQVEFGQLPPAVQRAASAQMGANSIALIQKVTRNGIPVYEIRSKNAKREPIYISEAGSWIKPESMVAAQSARTILTTGTAPSAQSTPSTPDGAKKVTFADLPAAVQNSVRGQAGNAAIEDIDAVTKNGRTTYEVAFKRDGKPVELLVDAQGQVINGTQAVASTSARVPLAAATKVTFAQTPAAVQNRLRTMARGAEIEDIDKGTVQGRTVYEAAFKHNGENIELRVAEDGSLLKDQPNANFLARFTPPASTNAVAVGQAPSWQGLTASRSSLSELLNPQKLGFRQVPLAAQTALRAQAKSGSIDTVTRGTLNGKTVYEASITDGASHRVIRVTEDGTLVP